MKALELFLRIAGVLQFTILIASGLVPRVLDWRASLGQLHPFLRRLFWVYGAFIVLVIAGFGALTLLNAGAMAAGTPLARSIAALIAIFWLARLAVQILVFDAEPFLTNRLLRAGYHCLTLAFIYLTAVYGWAALFPAHGIPALVRAAGGAIGIGLTLAAAGQVCIAMLNLGLVPLLHWKDELARVPLLMREVFHVHAWFISITLLIFAALTFRFTGDIAAGTEAVYRWIACAIGAFWAIRAILQFAYYSSSHWRGIASRLAVHIILLAVYGGFAAVYLAAGLGR